MRLPTGPIRQKVRDKASSYALDTPDSSSSSYGGEEYTSKNASADIYLLRFDYLYSNQVIPDGRLCDLA